MKQSMKIEEQPDEQDIDHQPQPAPRSQAGQLAAGGSWLPSWCRAGQAWHGAPLAGPPPPGYPPDADPPAYGTIPPPVPAAASKGSHLGSHLGSPFPAQNIFRPSGSHRFAQ